jgi:hypothetical protein
LLNQFEMVCRMLSFSSLSCNRGRNVVIFSALCSKLHIALKEMGIRNVSLRASNGRSLGPTDAARVPTGRRRSSVYSDASCTRVIRSKSSITPQYLEHSIPGLWRPSRCSILLLGTDRRPRNPKVNERTDPRGPKRVQCALCAMWKTNWWGACQIHRRKNALMQNITGLRAALGSNRSIPTRC